MSKTKVLPLGRRWVEIEGKEFLPYKEMSLSRPHKECWLRFATTLALKFPALLY